MIAPCNKCKQQIMAVRTIIGRTICLDTNPIRKWVQDQEGHSWAYCDCYTEHICNKNPPSSSLFDQQGTKTGREVNSSRPAPISDQQINAVETAER